MMLLLSMLHVSVFCRKVDYFNAKGFVKDPHTIVATLASGQQVMFSCLSADPLYDVCVCMYVCIV